MSQTAAPPGADSAAGPPSRPAPSGGAMSRPRALLLQYRVESRVAAQREMQYRFGNFVNLLGFLFEPTILMAVWTAVAKARGGQVHGYDAGSIAAYYITWTLVRAFNLVLAAPSFEWEIQRGTFAARMLRPSHPIHHDIAWFAGWKVVVFLFWIPIAFVLSLTFHPSLHPDVLQMAVFAVSLWGAFLVRSLVQWSLGLVCFWTTRAAALFDLYILLETLLSGRLVPMAFLPHWAQTVSYFMPFRWCFFFPIDALTGHGSAAYLLEGLAWQAGWMVVLSGVIGLVWKRAVRRHAAVGG